MHKINQFGQTLVELVVVIAVSVIVVGSLTFATIASIRNASFAKNSAQATKLAQEGLEKVRTGRDRNKPITGLAGSSVTSWNGNGTAGSAIWDYQIEDNCGNTNPTPPLLSTYCYFNLASDGTLNFLAVSSSIPSNAEPIVSFKRSIILSDDANWQIEKKITAQVSWSDFSGPHESRLTTILRKL